MTRYWAEVHPAPFARGTADFASFYGMLIGGLGMDYVNGIGYKTVQPVPEEEIPQRFARADEVFAQKLWREQLSDWDDTFKPAAIAKHRELQAVNADALADDELLEYLGRCRDHHAAMITQHMRYTASAVVPTGDFLAHVGDWTGLPPSQLLALMRGASPVSAGASEELERLVAAIGADPRAQELLTSDGDAATTLESCGRRRRGWSGHGRLSRARRQPAPRRLRHLRAVGARAADQLLGAIRTEVATGASDTSVEAQTADVRSKVPEEHRESFDELLGEARLLYRLRDERGVYSDIWASGIMRRAVLAAGRRVTPSGRIHAPEHLLEAGFDEMRALLEGSGGPSADELAARADYRNSRTAKDAPATLGSPPPPPPDPSTLPPAAGRLMRATGLALGALFGSSEAEHDEDRLRGLAASPGVYEGSARLVSGPADFNRIVKGEVLVTVSTSEAFNILLPLLGGIVTDSGGLLSHSAIVAREYGIPGVVGTRDATERIPDGARVRVDGDAGEVTVFA